MSRPVFVPTSNATRVQFCGSMRPNDHSSICLGWEPTETRVPGAGSREPGTEGARSSGCRICMLETEHQNDSPLKTAIPTTKAHPNEVRTLSEGESSCDETGRSCAFSERLRSEHLLHLGSVKVRRPRRGQAQARGQLAQPQPAVDQVGRHPLEL